MANSSRQLLKATYVPVNVASAPPAGAAPPPQPNLMKKIAFLRGLNVKPSEIAELRRADPGAKKNSILTLTDAAEQSATAQTSIFVGRHGKLLADIQPQALADFVGSFFRSAKASSSKLPTRMSFARRHKGLTTPWL